MSNIIDDKNVETIAVEYNLCPTEASRYEAYADINAYRGYRLAHVKDRTCIYVKVHLPEMPLLTE